MNPHPSMVIWLRGRMTVQACDCNRCEPRWSTMSAAALCGVVTLAALSVLWWIG